jgi:hypothetical protein
MLKSHGEDGGMSQDRDLIRSAQTADQEAFRALVERYRLPVLRTTRILLTDSALAEDVAQEAWVNAWRALGHCDSERPFRPSPLSTGCGFWMQLRHVALSPASVTPQTGTPSAPQGQAGRLRGASGAGASGW